MAQIMDDAEMNMEEDEIQADEMFAGEDVNEEQFSSTIDFPKIVLCNSSTCKPDPISDDEMFLLYKTLGIPIDQTDKKFSHWRLNSVHIRGVQNMSTSDVLDYFNEFEPDHIEWVNDYSCNVLFSDAKSAATVISKLSEALVVQRNLPAHDDLPPETKVVDSDSLEVSVPPYYWYLGKKADKAAHLLLRFSTTSDRKMLGARKHSHYYEKYGLPDEVSKVSKFRKIKRKVREKFFSDDIIKAHRDDAERHMRADEEQSKASLSDRLGIPTTRRLSDNYRPSVWDRLGGSGNEGKIVERTIDVGPKRFRITSRFSRSAHQRVSRGSRRSL